MRVFGRIVEPSIQSVATFVRILKADDIRMNDAVYAATSSFISQCRRKVEYVRRVYSSLRNLESRLVEGWRREVSRSPESIDPPGPRDLRDAVVEVETLMVAYEEFSERSTLGESKAKPS